MALPSKTRSSEGFETHFRSFKQFEMQRSIIRRNYRGEAQTFFLAQPEGLGKRLEIN
jgi:hypothetical protein